MAEITTLFWDIGGVILTNGWDRATRDRAAKEFGLDREDFEDRHELINPAFEMGQVGLDEYLERTVFCHPRAFHPEQFKAFMFAQSQANPETRTLVERLARSERYLMATINNEGLELNLYRIEKFDLRRDFAAFFSSCFVGERKPDAAIYRFALQVTQRKPEECVFIDDRPLNLECARRLGLRTIHYRSAEQLQEELRRNGAPPQ